MLADIHQLLAPQAQAEGITLLYPRVRGLCLILSDYSPAREGLTELLEALIQSSYADTELSLSLYCCRQQDALAMGLQIRSHGAGFNDEALQAVLSDAGVDEPAAALANVQLASSLLRDANIRVRGRAWIGQGCELSVEFALADAAGAQVFSDFQP